VERQGSRGFPRNDLHDLHRKRSKLHKPAAQTRNRPQSRGFAKKYSLLSPRNTLKGSGFIPFVSSGSKNEAGAENQGVLP
jgi:hypothetical protein